MRVRRRQFVTLAGGAYLASCASRLAPQSTTPITRITPGDFAAVRALFDQDASYNNMTGFLLMPNPKPVRDAIQARRAELDSNPAIVIEQQLSPAQAGKENYEIAARNAAGRFISVNPDEIALTDSTTMGLGLVYNGFRIAAGKEVIVDSHGHYSTFEALRLRAAREDVPTRIVDLYADPAAISVDEVVSKLGAALRPETRLVAVTWVHSSTGVKMPIRALASGLAELNANRSPEDRVFLAVDGVHGFGVENVSMADLGCDIFIAGCHKWMCGPRGTGIIWAQPEAWAEIRSTIPSFEHETFGAWLEGKPATGPGGHLNTPGGFHSFENRWALSSAFEFQSQIGRAAIENRIHTLNSHLKAGLRALPKVKLHTPVDPALSCGINCFDVDGKKPEEIVQALMQKRIIASTSPYRVSYARLAASLLNDEQQVDAALAEVAKL